MYFLLTFPPQSDVMVNGPLLCLSSSHPAVYGTWSNRGCRLVGIVEGVVTCECTHLTHFGLLLVCPCACSKNDEGS